MVVRRLNFGRRLPECDHFAGAFNGNDTEYFWAYSCCRAVFVDNEENFQRVANLKPHLPALEQIIIIDRKTAAPGDLSFDHLLSRGAQKDSASLNAILNSIETSDVASIMYTSGSTGEPKGVMRTQGNLLANLSAGREIAKQAE